MNVGVINQVLYYAYFFVVGGHIAQTKLYLELKRKHVFAALVLLAVNCYVYLNYITINMPLNAIRIFVVANLVSAICFYLISKTEVNCLLRVMGENTLQIYVIHCFVTAGLRLVFKVAGINSLFLYMIVGTILGVLIPVVIAKICTRIYCLNFVFQPTKTIQRLRSC